MNGHIFDYLLGHDPLPTRLLLARMGAPIIHPLLQLSIPKPCNPLGSGLPK